MLKRFDIAYRHDVLSISRPWTIADFFSQSHVHAVKLLSHAMAKQFPRLWDVNEMASLMLFPSSKITRQIYRQHWRNFQRTRLCLVSFDNDRHRQCRQKKKKCEKPLSCKIESRLVQAQWMCVASCNYGQVLSTNRHNSKIFENKSPNQILNIYCVNISISTKELVWCFAYLYQKLFYWGDSGIGWCKREI